MKKKICIIKGDGIGPEIIEEAVNVLNLIAKKYGHHFEYQEAWAGGSAWEKYGNHLPLETLRVAENSDAILFGAVGGRSEERNEPKWKNCEKNSVLVLRKHFNLFLNLRPAIVFNSLKNISVLKSKLLLENKIDLILVRELTGGIYFSEHKTEKGVAEDVMRYSEGEIRRVAKFAFELAKKRRKKLTSVDKANVLDCSRLWRKVVEGVAKDYPEVELEHLYIDNASFQMVKNPFQFDVILTENMFGDILSDLLALFSGSIGILPSASLNETYFGLYEPVSGSAPDIAGYGIANPIGQILSTALMMRYSFGLEKEAKNIEQAVKRTLEQGYRTFDIWEKGCQKLTTREIGGKICQNI